MQLPSFFCSWRRVLICLAIICMVFGLGFAAWLLNAFNASEDKVGEIRLGDGGPLVLNKTGPNGISYTIDNARATFRLDVAQPDKNCDRLFPDYASALKYAKQAGIPSMPSVQMIHGKCKQFDDDLCVTLEQLVQTGSADIPGKSPALQRLVQKLMEARNTAPEQVRPAMEQAILHAATAVTLGGGHVDLNPALNAEVAARKAAFMQNPLQATPTGFWTENETLRQTFTQDRYLMQGIQMESDTAACIVLARVISDDPELARAFDFFREFDSRLTNPPVYIGQDVADASPAKALSFRDVAAVLPADVALPDLLSPAQVLQTRTKLAGTFGADAGFTLINYAGSPEYSMILEAARNGESTGANASLELIIDAIQRGKLSLKPVQGSGWYDYQWYELETLLIPERATEAAKLTLTDAYKKRLEEAFKSSLAKNRETHIKQLPEIMMGMHFAEPAPPLEIHPEFSAEPTITVYLRTARSYRFLHKALSAVLDDETLQSLRRTSPGNPDGRSLGDELNRMALLCYGIHNIVSGELGLHPSYLPDEISPAELEEAKQIASQWLASAAGDPDLARDTRIAVPVAADSNGTVDYWATGGVRLQRVKYDYKREPRVGGVTPVFVPGYYYLPTDVALEFRKSGPLTRKEFQRMCDSCADEASLRKLLGAPDRAATRGLSQKIWNGAMLLLAGIALFLAWKTRRALSRRAVSSAVAVVALLLEGWIARVCLDEGYRTKFIIRHLASRNTGIAMLYMDRCIYPCMGDEKISPALLRGLVDLLRDADPQTRYLAVTYLGFLNYEKLSALDGAEESLHNIAADSDPLPTRPALFLLGAFKDDRNVEFLRARLNDDTLDEDERAEAAFGLGRTADPRGMDAALLAATGMTAFPPGHREQLAMHIQDVPTQVLAYENMLLSPRSQSSKTAAALQIAAAQELADLKSAAVDAIPAMEKTLQNPQTDPQVRAQLEKAIKSVNQSLQSRAGK